MFTWNAKAITNPITSPVRSWDVVLPLHWFLLHPQAVCLFSQEWPKLPVEFTVRSVWNIFFFQWNERKTAEHNELAPEEAGLFLCFCHHILGLKHMGPAFCCSAIVTFQLIVPFTIIRNPYQLRRCCRSILHGYHPLKRHCAAPKSLTHLFSPYIWF